MTRKRPGKAKRERIKKRRGKKRRGRPKPSRFNPGNPAVAFESSAERVGNFILSSLQTLMNRNQPLHSLMSRNVEAPVDNKASEIPKPELKTTQTGRSFYLAGAFVSHRLDMIASLCSETNPTPRARDKILAIIDEIRRGCDEVAGPNGLEKATLRPPLKWPEWVHSEPSPPAPLARCTKNPSCDITGEHDVCQQDRGSFDP